MIERSVRTAKWIGNIKKYNFLQQVSDTNFRKNNNTNAHETFLHEEFIENISLKKIHSLYTIKQYDNKSIQYPENQIIELTRKKCHYCLPHLNINDLKKKSSLFLKLDLQSSSGDKSLKEVFIRKNPDYNASYDDVFSIYKDPESSIVLNQRVSLDHISSQCVTSAKEAPTIPLIRVQNYEIINEESFKLEPKVLKTFMVQNPENHILYRNKNLQDTGINTSTTSMKSNSPKIDIHKDNSKFDLFSEKYDISSFLSVDLSNSLEINSTRSLNSVIQVSPPTYSSIQTNELIIEPSNNYSQRSLVYNRIEEPRTSRQFISRFPPPTYAESELNYYEGTIGLPAAIIFWGPKPSPVICNFCGQFTITRVKNRITRGTHTIACILCLFFCWPCCLLPYFVPSCKYTEHYCSQCKALLGVYRPI